MDPSAEYRRLTGSELQVLLGSLAHLRDEVERVTADLSDAQLLAGTPTTAITLAGLLSHLSFVEDHWFGRRDTREPYLAPHWDPDGDHGWKLRAGESPSEVRERWRSAVRVSDWIIDGQVEHRPDALGQPLALAGGRVSLRWALLRLIAEYARHLGHADLIRATLDD